MLAQSLNAMAEQLDQRIQTIVRQQNEHQGVLASMNEGVMAVDLRGRILNLNGTCAGLLGVEVDKVRGRMVHEVVRKPNLLSFIERTLSNADPVEAEFELSGAENRWIHAHGTARCTTPRISGSGRDRPSRRNPAARLESIRRDFVANVSRVENADHLDQGICRDPDAREPGGQGAIPAFLAIVLKQVNRLDAIIEDLLLLSRIERGAEEQTVELTRECLVDVCSAVEMCQRRLRKADRVGG